MKGYSKTIPNYYSIKKYNNDYYKFTFHKFPIKNGGFEENKEDLFDIKDTSDIPEGKFKQSISRSRSKIFEYAMCNDFDYFVTLTLDPKKNDVLNISDFIKRFGQFVRNNRNRKSSNIQYLLIPEKHKSGSWHLHGLIKGINENDLFINENGYLDWEEYKKRFGYISLSKVKNQVAVSKYITKYISKSLANDNTVTEKEKKIYYVSRGLKQAVKVDEGTFYDIDFITFDYEGEYVNIKELNHEEYLNIAKRLQY